MRKSIIAAAGTAILLTACDVNDPIYNTPHPEQGQVIVSADWSAAGTGITAPASYTVLVGDDSYTASTSPYTIPDLFNPGDYTFYFHNSADAITMNGTVATVATVEGELINNMPGWFFSAALDTVIVRDAVHELTGVMAQQVRELRIDMPLTGDAVTRVESITATLSGVARTLDINGNIHATPSLVTLTFTPSTIANVWTATVRLLGIVPNIAPNLRVVVKYNENNPVDYTFDKDMSTELANFNANKANPLILNVGFETATETEISGATINDWVVVEGGEVVAD